MKTLKIAVLIIAGFATVQAQSQIETSVEKSHEDETSYCVNVEIENNDANAQNLVGQNIRFFYNSEVLSFDKTFMDGEIQESLYNFDIKTDVKGLNKEKGSQLSYDDNMGFVNYSIISNDDNEQVVLQPYESIHAQTVCFAKISDSVSDTDVVLAKLGVSDDYSKAYVQIEVTPHNDEILYPLSQLEVDDQRDLAGLHK